MKNTDKPLLAIVGGIIFLVVLVFIVVLRQPAPEYLPEDTPEHIAHNYLLALRQQEYERAYSYLSPTLINYPRNLNQFIQDIESSKWSFGLDSDISLAVESTRVLGGFTIVTIEETRFYNRGLFDSYQSTNAFTMHLSQQNNAWKINRSESFWDSCWHRDTQFCR